MLNVKTLVVGAIQSNCFIVYNEEEAVVIDPGADGEYIVKTLYDMNLTVKHILLTHGHFDHIGAIEYIQKKYNCNVYINRADLVLLKNADLNLSSRFGTPIIYNGNVIEVGEETIELIGCNFTFISTPGHTPGSMCIKVNDFLFTGDTLFKSSIGRAFEPYGDTELEIYSIKEKLLLLEENLKCFAGHGPNTTLNYEKEYNPYLH